MVTFAKRKFQYFRYASQLPPFFNRMSVAGMFVIEIIFPFLLFVPLKPLQHLNAISQIFLQIGIIFTGNYGFFNYLTIALCLPLMDNSIFLFLVPSSKRKWFKQEPTSAVRRVSPWPIVLSSIVIMTVFAFVYDVVKTHYLGLHWDSKSLALFLKYALPSSIVASALWVAFSSLQFTQYLFNSKLSGFWKFYNFVKNLLYIPLIVLLFANTLIPYTARIDREFAKKVQPFVTKVAFPPALQNFHLSSSYGLFAT
jgi:hypothetical protein